MDRKEGIFKGYASAYLKDLWNHYEEVHKEKLRELQKLCRDKMFVRDDE